MAIKQERKRRRPRCLMTTTKPTVRGTWGRGWRLGVGHGGSNVGFLMAREGDKSSRYS